MEQARVTKRLKLENEEQDTLYEPLTLVNSILRQHHEGFVRAKEYFVHLGALYAKWLTICNVFAVLDDNRWIWIYGQKCRDINAMQWMDYTYGENIDNWNFMDWAAYHGHLEVVQWLHKHREEGCTTKAMDWAAENGHLDVVQWLHENREEGCTTKAMDLAAENGHLDVVKWLHENRTEGCTIDALDWAPRNVWEWLHESYPHMPCDLPIYAM